MARYWQLVLLAAVGGASVLMPPVRLDRGASWLAEAVMIGAVVGFVVWRLRR